MSAPGGFYIYNPAGRLIYEQCGESGNIELSLPEGNYKAQLMERAKWEGKLHLYLKLTRTEIEETVKYHEVQVTVERLNTVTNHRKVPLWRLIFGKTD